MSLTLDEVRQIRFRMSRRNETGYQVGDVDNSIDKVELTFDELETERERLRRELESAQASATGEGFTGGRDTDGDDSELRSQLEAQAAELRAKDDELARLQSDVERLNQAINQGGDVAAVQSAADERINDLVAQNEQLRSQLEQVRSDFDRVRAEQVTAIGGVEHLTVSASHDAAPAVTRLLQMATDQATTLVNEAQTEAQRKIADPDARKEMYDQIQRLIITDVPNLYTVQSMKFQAVNNRLQGMYVFYGNTNMGLRDVTVAE